jgi:ribokinase
MKVLVFGSLNHIVSPGETVSSRSLKKSAGGKGANQVAALGKTGVEVF